MRLTPCSILLFSAVASAGPVTVIKAARLFDGKSDRLVSPGVVVVKDGKIISVGAKADVSGAAETIDLGDATLSPGFMDAHTHLTMEMSDDWKQDRIDGYEKPIPEVAIESTVHAKATLWAGFTTCRDVGSSDDLDIGLRNAIRSGKVPGPRMLVGTSSIGATGGHCDYHAARRGLRVKETTDGAADGPEAVRQAVRRNVKRGADVIKSCPTGGVLSVGDDVDTPQMTQAELDALVDEAHALRRKVAAHAHGASGAKRAIRAGVDSIEHGSFLDDEAISLMKQKGTFFVPTFLPLHVLGAKLDKLPPPVIPKAKAAMEHHPISFRKAIAAGVRIAFGTDAGVYPHGQNAQEFRYMVESGMTPVDALKAATSVDAQLLGLTDKLGTLEAGKIADVIAMPGDPVRDIRNTERVFFVMKEGVVYRNDHAAPGHSVASTNAK